MNSAEPAKIWAGARVAVLSPTPTHPQDFGNRKRIFRICSRYAQEGARITFIQYPAELEWREQIPFRADRAMSEAWAQYHIVPPTRLLHENPAGNYHSIDEWWDAAIGQFLTWLFSVESFDIFVVNYSWLSKALEFAPASTFKILDTHDKFSGRREMLESLGLHPEFFYTTEAQEKIALGRADLVWAIKREEAAQLQELSQSPVLALPHLDPFCALKRAEPDAEGVLRVGVIGARNNVNRMNIVAFLEEAEPIFRDAFAPVKVVIAGSVCDLLEDIESPFVELLGSVEKVEDFYRVVDCVAVPMLRSTGLKIKTGEALSLGLPVISLAHAFEGYEPASPLHGLTDFAAMARAIVDLAFAPRSALDALAVASAQAHRKTAASIAKAYRRSDALALENRRLIVMAVDSRALVSGSVFNLVLKSVHEALRESAAIAILVVRGQVADITANAEAVDRFRRVIVADDLCDTPERRAELSAIGVDTFNVAHYLASAHPAVLIADALHPALAAAELADSIAVIRPEMIALSDPAAVLDVAAHRYGRVLLSAPVLSERTAALVAAAGAEFVASPVIWRSSAFKFRGAVDHSGGTSIALLGSGASPSVAAAADMARAWGMKPFIISPAVEMSDDASAGTPCFAVGDYLASIVAGERSPPDFAVDFSAGEPGLAFGRELLDRLHVPVISTSAVGTHPSIASENRPFHASTLGELWKILRSLALEPPGPQITALKHAWYDLDTDRGWLQLWRNCMKSSETDDPQFA
ncbi:MAG TPA: glycosyltransferase [Rhizomicrobium sp.]|nr:glycosyltransferase [Rhizomicrobium sp.]